MISLTLRASFSLLATPERQWQAVRLHPQDDDLSSLLAEDSLCALASELPCIVFRDTPAEDTLLTALQQAGIRILPTAALAHLDTLSAPIPPSAQYLAGDWYLKALSGQGEQKVASRPMALKLAQLVATDADTHEIEDVFRHEPTLSYHLLRLVNSPGIGNGRRIDSFTQAIMVLGRRQLKRWMNLILFSTGKADPRAAMLLAHVTARARCMERLAQLVGHDKEGQEQAFMVGMFSLLGVMFNMSLDEVLAPLHLEPTLNLSLIHI